MVCSARLRLFSKGGTEDTFINQQSLELPSITLYYLAPPHLIPKLRHCTYLLPIAFAHLAELLLELHQHHITPQGAGQHSRPHASHRVQDNFPRLRIPFNKPDKKLCIHLGRVSEAIRHEELLSKTGVSLEFQLHIFSFQLVLPRNAL
ncbi:hypothetical protein ES703_59129 [subsurface metagenome]